MEPQKSAKEAAASSTGNIQRLSYQRVPNTTSPMSWSKIVGSNEPPGPSAETAPKIIRNPPPNKPKYQGTKPKPSQPVPAGTVNGYSLPLDVVAHHLAPLVAKGPLSVNLAFRTVCKGWYKVSRLPHAFVAGPDNPTGFQLMKQARVLSFLPSSGAEDANLSVLMASENDFSVDRLVTRGDTLQSSNQNFIKIVRELKTLRHLEFTGNLAAIADELAAAFRAPTCGVQSIKFVSLHSAPTGDFMFAVRDMARLTTLELRCSRLGQETVNMLRLHLASRACQVKDLFLCANDIHVEFFQFAETNTSLRRFAVEDQPGNVILRVFAKHPSVTTLEILRGIAIDGSALAQFLIQNKTVTRLNKSGTGIYSVEGAAEQLAEGFAKNLTLRFLDDDAGHRDWGYMSVSRIMAACLLTNRGLRKICLVGSTAGRKDLSRIGFGLRKNRAIEHLEFGIDEMDVPTAIDLAGGISKAALLKTVKVFALNSEDALLTEKSLGIFLKSFAGTKIERLCLNRVYCGEHGVQVISEAAQEMPSLAELTLIRCAVENRSARRLFRVLASARSFTHLDLSKNSFSGSPDTATAFSAFLRNPSLKVLRLHRVPIGAVMLKPLMDFLESDLCELIELRIPTVPEEFSNRFGEIQRKRCPFSRIIGA